VRRASGERNRELEQIDGIAFFELRLANLMLFAVMFTAQADGPSV
jgi:hypothetical protein